MHSVTKRRGFTPQDKAFGVAIRQTLPTPVPTWLYDRLVTVAHRYRARVEDAKVQTEREGDAEGVLDELNTELEWLDDTLQRL